MLAVAIIEIHNGTNSINGGIGDVVCHSVVIAILPGYLLKTMFAIFRLLIHFNTFSDGRTCLMCATNVWISCESSASGCNFIYIYFVALAHLKVPDALLYCINLGVACNFKMTFRFIIILILCVIQVPLFSQCIDKEKITFGGDWGFVDFIHRCPTYNFTFGGDTSKKLNVLDDPIDIMQASSNVLTLKKYVDNKIKEFAGDKFYSRVTFNSVKVVYADKLQTFIDRGREDVTLKVSKAKYFFFMNLGQTR